MTNNKVDVSFELGKIELRFGKMNVEIDKCHLSEIAKDSVISNNS